MVIMMNKNIDGYDLKDISIILKKKRINIFINNTYSALSNCCLQL